MESNQIDDYKSLLDQFISLFNDIKDIFRINLNDAFKSNKYNKLINSKLIKDTETIIAENNNDINKILTLKTFPENSNYSNEDNLFVKYILEYEKLIKNSLIINSEEENDNIEGHFLQNIPKSKIYKKKKEHEVQKLSDFIKSSQTISNSNILFEMGCGMSFLIDALLSSKNNNDVLYIGVDMNKKVIDNAKKKYRKYKNVYFIDSFINFDNFNEFYEKSMKNILIENNKLNENIFLFGLHSCGNLTSNTLRIFIKNDNFKSIAIVGCCLGLLNEYINPETKASKEFIDFYNGVGYTKNGKFLDNTLIFEINDNNNNTNEKNIGYPLCQYIRNNHKTFFFGRDMRNAAMLNNIENFSFDSTNVQKNFYRALLQKFLEENLEEYAKIYGIGKNKFVENMTFCEYLKNFLVEIKNDVEKDEKILKKIEQLLNEIEYKGNKFYEDYKHLSGKFNALTMIRIKFAKIAEYIIILDRIIYLIEQGINNVKLIRLFNNHISPRNLLIYATKD